MDPGGPTRKDVFDRAIDLVVDTNEMGRGWTTHLVTIQAALVAAAGAFFRGSIRLTDLIPIFVLSSLGASTAYVFTRLMRINWEWQGRYVETARIAQGTDPLLYSTKQLPPGFVAGRAGRTSRIMSAFGWGLILLWTVFFLLELLTVLCR